MPFVLARIHDCSQQKYWYQAAWEFQALTLSEVTISSVVLFTHLSFQRPKNLAAALVVALVGVVLRIGEVVLISAMGMPLLVMTNFSALK